MQSLPQVDVQIFLRHYQHLSVSGRMEGSAGVVTGGDSHTYGGLVEACQRSRIGPEDVVCGGVEQHQVGVDDSGKGGGRGGEQGHPLLTGEG